MVWRFQLFGIPVRVEGWFWLMGLLLGGSRLEVQSTQGTMRLLSWMIVWFVSVLLHEMGHAFFQRRFGGHPEILLYGAGGMAFGNKWFRRWEDIVITAAGPGVQILAGYLSLVLLHNLRLESYFLRSLLMDFGWLSIFWAIINLLPILPLDGGRLLDALTGGTRTRMVAGVGMVVGGAAAIYGLLNGLLFLAILFGYFAFRNYQTWQRGYRSNSFQGDF